MGWDLFARQSDVVVSLTIGNAMKWEGGGAVDIMSRFSFRFVVFFLFFLFSLWICVTKRYGSDSEFSSLFTNVLYSHSLQHTADTSVQAPQCRRSSENSSCHLKKLTAISIFFFYCAPSARNSTHYAVIGKVLLFGELSGSRSLAHSFFLVFFSSFFYFALPLFDSPSIVDPLSPNVLSLFSLSLLFPVPYQR